MKALVAKGIWYLFLRLRANCRIIGPSDKHTFLARSSPEIDQDIGLLVESVKDRWLCWEIRAREKQLSDYIDVAEKSTESFRFTVWRQPDLDASLWKWDGIRVRPLKNPDTE